MSKEEIFSQIRHFKIETDTEKLDLIDTDVYLDLLNKYNDLQDKLEEKDKVIDEAINFIDNDMYERYCYTGSEDRLLEILERGKYGK